MGLPAGQCRRSPIPRLSVRALRVPPRRGTRGTSGTGSAAPPRPAAPGSLQSAGSAGSANRTDPAAFGGLDAYVRQTGHIADLCRSSPPRPGANAVRLPGEGALRRKRKALERGVAPYAGVMGTLDPRARRLGVARPERGGEGGLW